MAIPGSAVLGRLLATEIRTTRQLEFVMTARAKGLMPGAVDRRHVLPGSLTSFIVQFGINLGEMLGGAIVAEALFTRNGLGRLLLDSVNQRDYPTAQTLLLIAITVAVLVQIITETYLIWADPRVRAGKG